MAGSPHRRPRLEDVAGKVGVSTGTVSLVLSNAPGPSAATRERVMAAAAELGYRPDRTASLLARRRAHLLGVMLDVRSTFHAELVADLHDAAEARCEALVLLGPDAPTARLNSLGEQIPVVVVGRRLRSATLDVVRSADDHGVAAAVDHLVGLGHRDIAFVDGGPGTIATDRRSGYQRAMRRHGLDDRVRVLAGDPTEVAGTAAAKQLLGSAAPPTAVVTYNDRVALGLLDGLLRAGVAVPEEVSVVGYDDSPSAQLPHVDLTTVSQDTRGQAENAVQAAIERLDGARTTRREVVLEPRLVVRRSTAAPRARAGLTRSAVNGAAAPSTAP